MAFKTHLFIVDPQVDFCDPKGALPVGGADKDMERLAAMIRRLTAAELVYVAVEKDADGNYVKALVKPTIDPTCFRVINTK